MKTNNTTVIKKLGIQHPIIQAPMAGGATTPELIAAVCQAGGLGSLGAGYMSPEEMSHAIKKIRELTKAPFAVNLFIPQPHSAEETQIQNACHDIAQCSQSLGETRRPALAPYMPDFAEQMQVVYEEKVPVFSFTFGLLEAKWIERLQSNKTRIIGTATTVAEAQALERSCVDMIVVQGSEAGGHRGTFLSKEAHALIELSELLRSTVNELTIPVIAAGGIMDGKMIAKALTAGAGAVQMGTAFLSCHESGIPNVYKQVLLQQQQDNTTLTRAFSGKLARGIRNQFIDCMQNKLDNILDYPIQNALTKPMRQKAKAIGATQFMSLWAGQSAALCRDLSAAELVKQLMIETLENLKS